MKFISIIFAFFILSFSVSAEDAFKVHVHSFDPDINLEKIKSKNIEVKSGAGKYISQTQDLPSPYEMDNIFKKAGLGKEVLNMDQMDKDLLYLKAQKRPMEYLLRKFPSLPEKKLETLKKLIETQS